MNWFYNLRISTKLIMTFLLIAFIGCIVGIIGVINIKSIDKAGNDLYQLNTLPIKYLGVIDGDYQELRVYLRDIVFKNSNSNKDHYITGINANFKEIEDNIKKYELAKKYELTIESSDEQRILNNLKTCVYDYIVLKDKIIGLVTTQKVNDAETEIYSDSAAKIATALADSINKLIDFNANAAKQKDDKNTNTANISSVIMIIAIIVAMLISVVLGIFISRIISIPIQKLVEAADKIALGDINIDIVSTTKEEIGSLMQSFGKMAKSIRELVDEAASLTKSATEGLLDSRGNEQKFKGSYREIVEGINRTLDAVIEPIKESASVLKEVSKGNMLIHVKGNYKGDHADIKNALNETINSLNESLLDIDISASQVAEGANQISSSGQILSQGSSEQSSSIEEINASMVQIAAQTKLNAENANQANELAVLAKNNAISGNDQMKEMQKSMQEINESSSSISKIIKVIDEIAFQTNILALNAAVEAARAGLHGKGFAVVAEEVRNLAARSASAAKETTELIEGSIKKVEMGTKLANETAVALNKIVDGVAKSADLVGGIAIASNEQATGIAQINVAIELVAKVVQTNSATAQESAAASEELSGQAHLLRQIVSKFELKKTRNSSSGYDDNISPEMIHIIEQIMREKNFSNMNPKKNFSNDTYKELEPIGATSKIHLRDKEYGKY